MSKITDIRPQLEKEMNKVDTGKKRPEDFTVDELEQIVSEQHTLIQEYLKIIPERILELVNTAQMLGGYRILLEQAQQRELDKRS